MSKVDYYHVRVNCVGFRDYVVFARSKDDAVNEAIKHFNCDSTEAEFGEILGHDDLVAETHLEVFYPPKSLGKKLSSP